MNKEQIHDAQISPLMDQIIAICREHKIAMLATFFIPTEGDDGLACTSHLPDETGNLPERIQKASRIIRGGTQPLMLTTKNAAGEITNMTAILP